MNYSRTKRHFLVKITSWMIYNHISLSQKERDKRKMIQNGSDINSRSRETTIRISLESAHVTSEHLGFLLLAFESGFRCSRNGGPPVIWIISLYLWDQVYFVVITIVEFLITVLSITYLNNIFCGWTISLISFPRWNISSLRDNLSDIWHDVSFVMKTFLKLIDTNQV